MRRTLLVMVAGALGAVQDTQAQGRFVNVPYTVDGASGTAAVWMPADYDPAKKWPLVVYLHGGSNRGDHGSDATGPWLDDLPIVQAIRNDPGLATGLVLIPRCPTDTVWVRHPADEQVPDCCGAFARLQEAYPVIDAALEKTLSAYAVDPDRVTLTGVSLAAMAAFDTARSAPTDSPALPPSPALAPSAMPRAFRRCLCGCSTGTQTPSSPSASLAPRSRRFARPAGVYVSPSSRVSATVTSAAPTCTAIPK
jgi:poly(3-hydroxybutyrate) depolymerase